MTNLDDELRALLAVEPSPDFAARVRERVSIEPAAGSRWKWACIPLAAAAVAVLAIDAVVSRDAVSPPHPPVVTTARAGLPHPPAAAAPAPPPTPPASTPSVVRPERSPAVERRDRIPPQRVAAATVAREEPEILIDWRQKAALNRLIAMTQRGTMVATGLAEPTDAPISVTEAVAVAPLIVDQLQVPPIATQKQPWQ